MRTERTFNIITSTGSWLISALLTVGLTPQVLAQTSIFTYQGNLAEAGSAAEGPFDFSFHLYDAETGGSEVVGGVSHDDVPVNNGLFSALLDFGSSPFGGDNRWLEIRVRPGASMGWR